MGIFTFNPIFSRGTVPMRVRVAMSLVLTLVMLASMDDVIGYIPENLPNFVMVIMMEAALGLVFGFIVNMILSLILLAGKIIDNQMTIALSEMMDPSTNVSMPIMASLYYYLFVFYFFITGGHLSYIALFALSYEIIPIGFEFTPEWIEVSHSIVMFLGTVMTLAVKMAMPIIAAEMILQICVGVMMKAVPNIQIFVINIQMKILVGFFLVMAMAGPMSDFIQRVMDIMFENLYATLYFLGQTG
jgi:flagellar biosynthetic protein FliR